MFLCNTLAFSVVYFSRSFNDVISTEDEEEEQKARNYLMNYPKNSSCASENLRTSSMVTADSTRGQLKGLAVTDASDDGVVISRSVLLNAAKMLQLFEGLFFIPRGLLMDYRCIGARLC